MEQMELNIKIYNKCKYEEDSNVIADVHLSGIISLEVKKIPASEILRETDESCFDYNKYVIITFDNGDIIRYRNCYIDVFRIDR